MRTGFRVVVVLAGCAAAAITFLAARSDGAQTTDEGFKRFDNSIVPLPPPGQSRTAPISGTVRGRKLLLHFALEPRNFSELESRIAGGAIISPAEMKERYSGPERDFTALLNWLKGQGFEIVQTSPDFTGIYAKGTVGQIGKSLGVEMRQITYKGRTLPAATTPPRLPITVGEHVMAIDGLQPFIQAVKRVAPHDQNKPPAGQRKPPIPRPGP